MQMQRRRQRRARRLAQQLERARHVRRAPREALEGFIKLGGLCGGEHHAVHPLADLLTHGVDQHRLAAGRDVVRDRGGERLFSRRFKPRTAYARARAWHATTRGGRWRSLRIREIPTTPLPAPLRGWSPNSRFRTVLSCSLVYSLCFER